MPDVVWETALPGLPPPQRGKVRDVYDLGDELLIVASDRLSAYDHVLRPGIPGKGKILNQLSNFWFDRFAGVVPHHLLATDVDDFPRCPRRPRRPAARPLGAGAQGRGGALRVRGARLSRRQRVQGVLASTARPAASRCRPASSAPAACRSRSSPPPPRRRPATTRTSTSPPSRAAPAPSSPRACATSRSTSTAAARSTPRERGLHPGRHQVRVRYPGRRADPDRRGADAGLLALLGRRPLAARRGARLLRQAVRAQLARRVRLGPRVCRRPSCRARWSRARASATSRRSAGSPAASRSYSFGTEPSRYFKSSSFQRMPPPKKIESRSVTSGSS